MGGRWHFSAPGRFLRETSGHFAILTAIMTPLAIMLAAVAVDTGALYVEKRHAQALADLAAITAAANITKPQEAARIALTDNGVGNVAFGSIQPDGTARFYPDGAEDQIVVVSGRYERTPTHAVADRFVPASSGPRNAVKVIYRTTGTRYFGGALIDPPQIIVSAVAETSTAAAFSIGSRLAALEGGALNSLLSGLLGSNITLSLMDYDALLAADIRLLSFLDALALELDLTGGTYKQVLDTEVTLGQVARALSTTSGLGSAAQAAARSLATQAGGWNAPRLRLSRLIDLGESGGQVLQAGIDRIGLDVGVLDLLTASAIAAGKGKQIALDVKKSLPLGLLNATVALAIGEPPQHAPWFRLGSGGELVRTAQTRLAVTVEIATPELLKILGARIRIPLYLELAFAEARLKEVTCPAGKPQVKIEARRGVADLYLAEIDLSKLGGFANPRVGDWARLVQIPLVSINGKAHAEIAEMGYETLTFTATDIASGKIRQVSTHAIVGSLTASLFRGLGLEAKVELGLLGIPLVTLPPGTLGILANTLGAAAPAIDQLLDKVLSTLGLALGQADIRVHGATCGRAVLVQ